MRPKAKRYRADLGLTIAGEAFLAALAVLLAFFLMTALAHIVGAA